MFNSDAKQDQFVANILKFKTEGIYLDIGSCNSVSCNNSFYFDSQLGWSGSCVEIDKRYQYSYSNRKGCWFLNMDALEVDYNQVLSFIAKNKTLDYLSLDVDTLSIDVLKKLPLDDFKFRVITIEHDAYLYGDTYRTPQREILSRDYDLICSNVLVEQDGYYGKHFPFEDWWVLRNEFSFEILDKIRCHEELPSKIIEKTKNI